MTHLSYTHILHVMQEGGDPLTQLLKTVNTDTPLAIKVVRAANDLDNTDVLMTLLKAGVVEALTPDLVRELNKLVEPLVEEEANRKAAQAWSTPAEGEKQWVLAEFGDAIAVNGDLLGDDDTIPTAPADWEPSSQGGTVPTTEEEVSLEGIVRSLAKDLGLPKSVLQPVEDALGRVARSASNLVYVSVSGETEIYVPPTKDEEPKAANGKRLVCPECGEPARKGRVKREGPMLSVPEKRLLHTHMDGTPLCPVVTSDGPSDRGGYRPALPVRENKASNGKRRKKTRVIREGQDPETDAYMREFDAKHGQIAKWEARAAKGLCPWCGKKPGPGCKKAKCQDKLQKAGLSVLKKVEKSERPKRRKK